MGGRGKLMDFYDNNNMGGHGKLMVSMTTVTTMTWVAVANSWFLGQQ